MQINIFNFKTGSEIKQDDVDYAWLDVKMNEKFLSLYFYKMRRKLPTTNKIKKLCEISGTTKKPFKQKGSGRARQGSRRAAQHTGGVKIFGPTGLSKKITIPKKETALAKAMLLSRLYKDGNLVFIDNCGIGSNKTKDAIKCLDCFGDDLSKGSAAILHNKEVNKNDLLSVRNIPRIKYCDVRSATVHDLMRHDKIFLTTDSIEFLSGLLKC